MIKREINNKILITGGCGFVGSNLAIYLKNKKFNITSLDNFARKGSKLNYKFLKNNNIKNLNIDIRNKKKISLLPRFDYIIDCCAEPSVEMSKTNIRKVFDINLVGTLNILEKITKDKSKLIFISSSRVYSINAINKDFKNKIEGKNLKSKINKNYQTLGAKSFYGFTKFASENIIEEFNYLFKIDYLINRCGVIAGPGQFGKTDQGFASLWVWKYLTKQNMKYIGYGGNGNQVRDLLHIEDFCELIYKQIKKFKKIKNETFTVGGGLKNATSLGKFSNLCEKIIGNKIYFSKIKKTSIYDIPYFVTCNKTISKVYGWSPKKNLSDLIKDTLSWQKTHFKVLKKYLK